MLIGLPGAGKSTIGRLAARALEAPFVDVDAEIEQRTAASIPQIFAEQGEAQFRHLEREYTRQALEGPPAVIATGGGWPAQPGVVEVARRQALVLYLHTEPAVAAGRTARGANRPLLAGNHEPLMRELLARREQFYKQADVTIRTGDLGSQSVADQVVMLARREGGW